MSTSFKKIGVFWQKNLFFSVSISPKVKISLPIFISDNNFYAL